MGHKGCWLVAMLVGLFPALAAADGVRTVLEREPSLKEALAALDRSPKPTEIFASKHIAVTPQVCAFVLLALAEAHRKEASSHLLTGQGYPPKVRHAYETALKEAQQRGDPELIAAALLRLGDVEASWERWQKAREFYQQAVATAPQSPLAGEALARLGQTYAPFFKPRKHEKTARTFWERVVAQYPNTFAEVISRYELGLQAVRQKRFQDAIAHLSRAAEIVVRQPTLANDPDSQHQRAEALYLLGWVLAKTGQRQAAISAFDEVSLRYRGNFPPSPINRQVWLQVSLQKAVCLYLLGRRRDSVEELKAFIAANPDHYLARRAQLLLLRWEERQRGRQQGRLIAPPASLPKQLAQSKSAKGNTCGLWALAGALQLLGQPVDIKTLQARYGTLPRHGLSLRDLEKLAQSFGVDAFVVHTTDPQSLLTLGVPLIAHEKNHHFVTVPSLSGTMVTLYDPSMGVYTLPMEKFLQRWSGYALVLGEARKRLLAVVGTRLRVVSEYESRLLFGTQDPVGCVNHVGCSPLYAPPDDPCACDLDALPEVMGTPSEGFPQLGLHHGGGCPEREGSVGCAFPLALSSPLLHSWPRSGQAVSAPWQLMEGNGPSPRFVFALLYNTFEPQDGPFGNIRWSYGLEGFYNGDTVQLVDWRGNRLYYQQLVDGTYLTPPGHVGFELRETTDAAGQPLWVWEHLKSGIKFLFAVEPSASGNGSSSPPYPEEGTYTSYRLYLASIEDRNGNRLTLQYQWDTVNGVSVWRPVAATDPTGATGQFVYHPNSLWMAQVVDPIGNAVTFQWQEQRDNQGRVAWRRLVVTDLMGGQWQFDFDIGRLLTRIRNPFGGEIRYEHVNIDYGHFVGLVGVILPNGFKRVFAWTPPEVPQGYEGWMDWQQTALGQQGFAPLYDASGVPTFYRRCEQRDYYGQTIVRFWVERRTVTGATSVTEYDGDGLPVRSIDELGREWRFAYHPTGQPTQVIDPLGRTTQYAYDAVGRLIAATDPIGNTTQYFYDQQGNLVQVVSPLGLARSFAYDQRGLKVSETDPLGNTTTFAYDHRGYLVQVTDPLGNSTHYQRDALGRLVAITDPTGKTVYYSYDPAGRVVQVTYPDGSTEQFAYNCCALTQKVDANGNLTRYEYDLMGRLVKEIDPLGREKRYEYDGAGRKVAEIDAKGRITRYDYDREGRLVQITFPDGTTERYEYDAVGNRIALIEANGTKRLYRYNALNRLMEVVVRR